MKFGLKQDMSSNYVKKYFKIQNEIRIRATHGILALTVTNPENSDVALLAKLLY